MILSETSSDGLRYSNKHILPELSLRRPAVVFIDAGRGEPYGTIVLAWTGTDPGQHLNVFLVSAAGTCVIHLPLASFW